MYIKYVINYSLHVVLRFICLYIVKVHLYSDNKKDNN